MPQCCSVPMCSSTKGGHKLPMDKTRRKQWIIAIRRDKFQPTIHSIVCKKHFRPEDYAFPKDSIKPNPTPLLKIDVVPSQFPWTSNSNDVKRSSQRIKNRKKHIENQRKNKDF